MVPHLKPQPPAAKKKGSAPPEPLPPLEAAPCARLYPGAGLELLPLCGLFFWEQIGSTAPKLCFLTTVQSGWGKCFGPWISRQYFFVAKSNDILNSYKQGKNRREIPVGIKSNGISLEDLYPVGWFLREGILNQVA